MKDSVFVTRNTYSSMVEVWDAGIGIVKMEGCVHFESGEVLEKRHQKIRAWKRYYLQKTGRKFYCSLNDCLMRYKDIPEAGEAWLVEDKGRYWLWTRVDQDMALLSEQTLRVLKE